MSSVIQNQCYWFHTSAREWLWITRTASQPRATVYLQGNIYLGELAAGCRSAFLRLALSTSQDFLIDIVEPSGLTSQHIFRHNDRGGYFRTDLIDDWPHICWDAKSWDFVTINTTSWKSSGLIHKVWKDHTLPAGSLPLRFKGTDPLEKCEMLFTPCANDSACGPSERYVIGGVRPRVTVEFDHCYDAGRQRQILVVTVDMKRLQNVAPKLLWHRTGLGIDQAVGGRRGDQGQSSKSSARHRQTFEFLVDEILTGDTVQVQWPQEPPESVYRALLNGVVVQDKNVTSPYYFFQRPSNESADRRMRSTVLESVSGSTPTKRDGVTEGFSHIQEEVVRRGAGSLCEDSAARELLAEMPWALLDHFFQFIEHPDFHAVTSILAGGGGTLPEALSLFAGRPQDCFLLLARPAIRDLIENEKPAGSEIISIGDVLARSYVRSVQAAGVTTVPAHGTASTTCAAIAKHLNRCGDVELELWFESMHQGPTPEDWFVRRAIHGWGSVSEQMCREWTSRLVRLESLPWEKFDGLFISGDEIKPRIAAQRLQQEISRSAKDRINGQDLDRLESDLQQLCSVLREHLEQLMLIYRDLQGFSAQIQRLLLILEPSAIKDSRRRAFEDFTNQFTDLEVLADRSPLRHDGRTIPAIWFTSDHRWYGHLLARRPHREERLRELAGWFLCIFENRKLPKSSAEARPLPSEHFRPRLKPAWESFRVDMPQEELTFVLRWCNLESTGAEQLDSNIKEFQGYRTDLQSTPEALLLDDIIGHLADRRDAAIFVLHIPRICKAVSDRLEEFRLKACSRQLIEDAADMITGLESVRVGSFSRWKELPGMLTTLSELETTSSSSLNAWSNLLGTAPGIVRQAFASGPLEGVFFEAASSIDPIVEWVRAYSAEGIAVLRSELKQLSPATALDDGSRLEPRTADLARQFEKTRSAYENSIEPPKLYRDEWHRLVEWFQLAFEVESLRQSIRKPVVGGDG